jgi:hypothetical protein
LAVAILENLGWLSHRLNPAGRPSIITANEAGAASSPSANSARRAMPIASSV